MSVYGGDSWAREAQHRKRRVDDLLIEGLDADQSSSSSSSYKKLCNGKFTCLVCPRHPILDSPLMLSMHCKGSRHCAAESKVKERELVRQDEIKKRIALSDCSVGISDTGTSTKQSRLGSRPLIQKTCQAACEIVCNKTAQPKTAIDFKMNRDLPTSEPPNACHMTIVGEVVAQQQFEFRERREKELKFTAAGWKRDDGHGKSFRDENAEFDSDEEDPNVCLA